jgi:RNA polymerase sigma-70 factor (ECF subfamily)
MSVPETDLIARAQQGDASAFGRLYERHLDGIYRYVYYRVSDHDEAEDLTETVFLKAWEALPRFRTRGSTFRAWLYRIAHNAVIDRHRTHKTTLPLDEIPNASDDDTPTPEDLALAGQEAVQLEVALSRLDPRSQEVIVNRFVNGLSHTETAKVMGLRVGHVRVLQHRALEAMRQLLGKGTEQ